MLSVSYEFRNLSVPKSILWNLSVPKSILRNLSVPKSILRNLSVPKSILWNLSVPMFPIVFQHNQYFFNDVFVCCHSGCYDHYSNYYYF